MTEVIQVRKIHFRVEVVDAHWLVNIKWHPGLQVFKLIPLCHRMSQIIEIVPLIEGSYKCGLFFLRSRSQCFQHKALFLAEMSKLREVPSCMFEIKPNIRAWLYQMMRICI